METQTHSQTHSQTQTDTETQMDSIIVTDPLIVSFFKENPNLDFVTMIHIFINILKGLSTNLTETTSNTINAKILSAVNEMKENITSMKTDIISKFHDSKREYMDDLKLLLQNNSLTSNEKITILLEKSNDMLLTKTNLILNEVIPKSQEKNYVQIESCIKSFCSNITQDTTRLLELNSNEEKKVKQLLENIDSQFNKMFSTIQQPIFNFIKSSEERTHTSVQQIKDNLSGQESIQNKLLTEMNEFLNKYKNNSSFKGKFSEKELYYMLQSIMPTDEIIEVGKETAKGDCKVIRRDKTKPSILFENKSYAISVDTKEVSKFERDVQLQKMHGVFISQNSPITFKDNFQIDIINGLIHVYIPNAEYDVNKIKIAIDIIDNLSLRLDLIEKSSSNECRISTDDKEEIIRDFNSVANQKDRIIEMVKAFSKQMQEEMDKIQMPKLKQLFMNTIVIVDSEFKCTFCNSYTGKNKASLSSHLRSCKNNPKNKEETPPKPNGETGPKPNGETV
jgi:cytochrome c556